MGSLLVGGIAALGAAAFCVWGFFEAMKIARQTPAIEKIDWLKVTMTVAPSLVLGFLAGYAIDPTGWELVFVLTTGWTAADVGNRVGADDVLSRYFQKVD